MTNVIKNDSEAGLFKMNYTIRGSGVANVYVVTPVGQKRAYLVAEELLGAVAADWIRGDPQSMPPSGVKILPEGPIQAPSDAVQGSFKLSAASYASADQLSYGARFPEVLQVDGTFGTTNKLYTVAFLMGEDGAKKSITFCTCLFYGGETDLSIRSVLQIFM